MKLNEQRDIWREYIYVLLAVIAIIIAFQNRFHGTFVFYLAILSVAGFTAAIFETVRAIRIVISLSEILNLLHEENLCLVHENEEAKILMKKIILSTKKENENKQ